MHLYILARGIKHDFDRMLSELSAKYLPFKYHGEPKVLQVAVRPIQLFEVVFPKEHLSSMINSFGGVKTLQGQPSVGFLGKYLKILRKVLHLKPLENIDVNAPIMPFYKENVEVLGLGIKEDGEFPDGTEYI